MTALKFSASDADVAASVIETNQLNGDTLASLSLEMTNELFSSISTLGRRIELVNFFKKGNANGYILIHNDAKLETFYPLTITLICCQGLLMVDNDKNLIFNNKRCKGSLS